MKIPMDASRPRKPRARSRRKLDGDISQNRASGSGIAPVTPSACAGGTGETKQRSARPALARAPGRLRIWQPAFRAEIERLRELEPGWGRLDCITLVRDMVVALTGANPSVWPEGWRDEASARRTLARHGFADVGDVLAAVLPEIPPAFAQVGDVGTVGSPAGPAGCIVLGETLAVVRADGLSVTSQRSLLLRAFRV